jgi:glycosyltransferase EpsE
MRLYGAGYLGANITEPLLTYTEEKANFKRRTFKARLGEMKIRIHGFKAMRVMHWAFPFIFKPLVAWFVTLFKH